MTMDDAHKSVKQAAIAAFVSAGITLLLVLLALQSDADDALNILNDPFNFIDIALAIGCGIGLLRYSRAAAVTIFTHFIFSKIFISIELGRPAGIGIALIFLYFFWKGIRGSFAYHRLRHEADPNYRPAPKWSYFLGIPIAMVLLAAIGYALMIAMGVFPSTDVIDGSELSRSNSEFLIREGIVKPNETIQLFYSTGLTSILDDGNLLTDKRIISYEKIDGKLSVYAARVENVSDVKIIQNGNFLNDTIVEIWTIDGDRFRLFLSAENRGDKRFINAIKNRIGQIPNTSPQPIQ